MPSEVVDGMAAIRSVPPSAIYEEWFKILVKFITPLADARATSLKIIMDTYVEFSVKEGTRRQRVGEPGPRMLKCKKCHRVTNGY